jgi:hypothetical protein
MERIEPIGRDRTVPPVELRRLKPLEREEERQRRERERKRRQAKQEPPPADERSGIDIRV